MLVHGFTQTRRCWSPIDDDLRRDHEVVRVDAPGHGASGTIATDLWDGARRIGQVGGRAAYVGYSMGGRYLLHLALAQPEVVTALVVIGATGGIEDPTERSARHAADEARARRVEMVGAARFVDEWVADPPFARAVVGAGAFPEERRRNTTQGLAASLRLAGTGAQESLWGRLGTLTMPALIVVGSADAPFRPRAERLVECIGSNAELAVIDGAGHAAHLEQPERFVAALRRFLASHEL